MSMSLIMRLIVQQVCVDDHYAFGFTRRVFSSFVVMTPDALERLRTPAFEVEVSRGKGRESYAVPEDSRISLAVRSFQLEVRVAL